MINNYHYHKDFFQIIIIHLLIYFVITLVLILSLLNLLDDDVFEVMSLLIMNLLEILI